LHSEKKQHVDKKGLKYDHLLGYIDHLLQTILKAQDLDFLENNAEKAISVIIDDFGISPVDFKIDEKQKVALFNSGKKATIDYFKSMD
jgi:hypothetical protein